MPHAAVHKSKEKKRKGAGGAENEYARRLQNLDENLDVPIGRITKMLRADRFLVSFYDIDKKQTIEVQAGVVDRNVERLKPNVGSYVVPVESGSKYEIYLVLSDEDARRRSERIPKNILNVSFTGTANQNDDVGIEFVDEEVEDPFAEKPTGEEKKDKKDKGPKHVERVVREENDRDNEEVNIDDI